MILHSTYLIKIYCKGLYADIHQHLSTHSIDVLATHAITLYGIKAYFWLYQLPSTALGDLCGKTGASWGFHDAWIIGVSGNHVLAVWVGNFDGETQSSLCLH
ncbi:MAG: hypothetical protein CVU29_11075 [Betaproteobacteria bacterium HGW-Betaproteobacteria-22]|nr:MAG: hypothetical protein CVU29_11075 [Betaproteobacteria bacterium HGW-Betaproteobacteria-22]